MNTQEKETEMYVGELAESIELLKTLGSEARVAILHLIMDNEEISLGEMAEKLDITKSAVSAHMKMLEDVGIVEIAAGTSGHRNRKRYRICLDEVVIHLIDRNKN